MKIGDVEIGYGQPTFIIAEMCSNVISYMTIASDDFEHCIRDVASTGATAAKVQLFKHTHFAQSEWEQKKRVEFPRDWFRNFIELCHEYKLLAGASVFDEEAVQLCVDSGADFLKLATREEGNMSLVTSTTWSKLPTFISYDARKYRTIFTSRGKRHIWLSCVPEYPTHIPKFYPFGAQVPYDSDWGWSSHTPDWLDCLIAVSRGACVIEKHIGFHRDDPEMGWSLYPQQFKKMVEEIRMVELMR